MDKDKVREKIIKELKSEHYLGLNVDYERIANLFLERIKNIVDASIDQTLKNAGLGQAGNKSKLQIGEDE